MVCVPGSDLLWPLFRCGSRCLAVHPAESVAAVSSSGLRTTLFLTIASFLPVPSPFQSASPDTLSDIVVCISSPPYSRILERTKDSSIWPYPRLESASSNISIHSFFPTKRSSPGVTTETTLALLLPLLHVFPSTTDNSNSTA